MADTTNTNVISSASLQPSPAIQPVTPTPDTTNYSGITGGVTQSVMDQYADLNAKQEAAQANQQATGTSITDLMGQLAGKTADTQAANDAAGVTTETANLNKYAQQLADLNAQASSLNREAQAIPLQIQERNRNTGATDAGVAPQTAGDLRLNALKALSIGQQSDIAAAAATGSNLRLQAAKDKAQQIIDLKYQPIEAQIALKQKQYDLNKDVLDSIDKKRSEALQLSLQKEAQDLADKKEAQKINLNYSITNHIQEPYFYRGNEIIRTSDGEPMYKNVAGEIQSLDGTKKYASSAQFFTDAGISNWNQIHVNTAVATKFETVMIGSGKNNIKVRYGYDDQGNVVSATNLNTGQPYPMNGKTGGAVGISTVTPSTPTSPTSVGALTSKEKTKVNAIIAANPGEYGKAADQINRELGAGSASRADNLLKTAYMVPSDALEVSSTIPPDLTLDQWTAAKNKFIQDHSYSTSTAASAFTKFVPKPTKKGRSL